MATIGANANNELNDKAAACRVTRSDLNRRATANGTAKSCIKEAFKE